MIKAVIFDLDGVLVSTDELHYAAWKTLAEKENLVFDRSVNNRLRGVSRMDSLRIILENTGRICTQKEMTKMASFKNDLYVSMLDTLTPSARLPGVSETLSALAARNIRTAVGSSSRNAKKILLQTGLYDHFDAIADGNDIARSKPWPDVFLCAAKKLSVKPSECAVVEDAAAGIQAAGAAGMFACGLGDAKSSPLCDLQLDHLYDILTIWN